MDILAKLFQQSGFAHLAWGNWVMILVGGVLIYLAIAKKYEPLSDLPGHRQKIRTPAAHPHRLRDHHGQPSPGGDGGL